MSRTTYDDLRELAPTHPVDTAGLDTARLTFDRSLLGGQADDMLTVGGSVRTLAPDVRRSWGFGRVLVAVTASMLLVGAGAAGAVLIKDVTRPAEVGPQVGVPGPLTSPSASPSGTPDRASGVQCDDANMSVDGGPELPSSEWPDLIDHGWTLPDVPVTASPSLQSAPAECAAQAAAVVFADVADGRAVAVYAGQRAGRAPEHTSLDGAEVVRTWTGDLLVEWFDEADHPWHAQAGGISVEELRTILDRLGYSTDGSVTGPVPDGFERVETPAVEPEATLYLWRMNHDDVSSYLWATWPVTEPIEAGLTDGRDYEAVEFDGGVALYSPGLPGVSANPPSLRWIKDGVRFWLLDSGADLETLKARARSVRPLDLDSPELRPFLGR